MTPLLAVTGAVLVLSVAGAAAAQDRPPLTRGDVAGTVGWTAVDTTEIGSYSSYAPWHGQGLFTAGVGWYWTDHLKTDVEIGATTTTQIYGSIPLEIAGLRQYVPSQIGLSSTRVAVVQRYQFGRNQWFHPSVGAGVDLVRQRITRREDAVFVYDQITRQGRLVRETIQHAAEEDFGARALLIAGFKGYFTPRTFLLGDMRVTFASRPHDVLLRLGIGVDF